MPRLVSITRAAKLVGVPRGILQHRIQQGEIESFEGRISLNELARAYPDAQFEDNTMFEKIEQIIENAARNARIRAIRSPPDLETLAARVNLLSDELAEAKLEINAYQTIFDKLKYKLRKSIETAQSDATSIQALYDWLLQELDAATQQKTRHFSLLAADTLLSIMTSQVHLKPSGHEFLIEGTNSILDSALSAGLALNYGCSNGNCGKCKARVISGQIRKIRPHDYLLSEAEKLRGYILTCSYTAMTDVVLEADEATQVNDIPLQSISAWVRKNLPAGDDVNILQIKTPRTQRLRFLAGQAVNLTIPNLGTRHYHIASCPCDDRNLQFHIIRDDDDPVTQQFFNGLKSNDNIVIEGPQGQFVLQEDAPNPIVFIAFGSGFAPIKSLIEHAVTLDITEFIHLYWVVSHPGGIYLDNQCRAWTDALENFNYTPVVGHSNSALANEELVNQIVRDHPDFTRAHYYIAGEASLAGNAQNALIKQGINRNAIRIEAL